MTDEEKKPYHTVMTAAWRVFTKARNAEQFTDEWWREIIEEYDKLREPYKGTPMDDYVCGINQVFLDEWELIQKRQIKNCPPNITVESVFLSADDWE